MGGGRRQGQGLAPAGIWWGWGVWVGGVRSVGHLSNIGTRSARDVVGEGALRGRSPRTREGRIGPTAQLQWTVVSGQWLVTATI